MKQNILAKGIIAFCQNILFMGLEYLTKLTEYLVGKDIVLFKLVYTALDSVTNGVVITDPKGDILWVNKAFQDYTGYSFAELLLQNPRILKSGKHDALMYENMWKTIESGKTWAGSIYNKYKDGSIHLENMTISPVLNDAGKIVCYIAVKQMHCLFHKECPLNDCHQTEKQNELV